MHHLLVGQCLDLGPLRQHPPAERERVLHGSDHVHLPALGNAVHGDAVERGGTGRIWVRRGRQLGEAGLCLVELGAFLG